MLKKLLKYDFKALLPWYGIAFAACLIVALFCRISLESILLQADMESTNRVAAVLSTIATVCSFFGFALVIVGTSVLCMVLPVWRFYNSYIKDEAYLMFTLPVTTKQLYFSKLISATVGAWVSSIVIGLTAIIPFVGVSEEITQGFFEMIEGFALGINLIYGASAGGSTATMVVSIITGSLGMILAPVVSFGICYLSFMFGQLASKNRFIWSVVAYFVMQSVLGTVSQIVSMFCQIGITSAESATAISVWLMISSIATFLFQTLIPGILAIVIANRIMKKHLNLD